MHAKKTLGILLAILSLALAAGGAASADAGKPAKKGILYTFRGHLLTAPTAAGSIQISVEGGNHAALVKMLGQPVDQTFAVGADTEFLRSSNGVPAVVHESDLAAGDWLVVDVRAPRDATLAQLEAQPAGIVSDRGTQPTPPTQPLFLFAGTLSAVGSTSVTVSVERGNARALRLLVGQPAQQTFATGAETIYLLWQGKLPTVISASQLKVGDRVVVRVRADRDSTLAQVESTAAVHVGEHEPASTAITS